MQQPNQAWRGQEIPQSLFIESRFDDVKDFGEAGVDESRWIKKFRYRNIAACCIKPDADKTVTQAINQPDIAKQQKLYETNGQNFSNEFALHIDAIQRNSD